MKYISTLLVMLCYAVVAQAQDKPVVEVSPDLRNIQITLTSGNSLPGKFTQNTSKDFDNYQLHELEPVAEPGVISKDRTALIDTAQAPACAGHNCQRVSLRLTQPLVANQTYILAIRKFTNEDAPVTVRFGVKAAPATPEKAAISKGPDVTKQRSQLTLRSKTAIDVAPNVTVYRKYYKIKPDNTGVEEAADAIPATTIKKTDILYVLDLGRKLIEGQDLDLYIQNGITNSLAQNVRAEGKLKLSGIPTKPEDIRLDVNLASTSAVHQKPVFELTGKFIPTRIYQVKGTEWIWEPTATADLGLRSTKSTNSVVLAPFTFSNYIGENWESTRPGRYQQRPPSFAENRDGTEVPIYADWVSTPWYRLSDIKFTTSPIKGEFDRNFKRKNLLASARFDLNFHRWRATVKDKSRILEQNFSEDVVKSMRIDYGWSLVPYLSFDAGGHVNNETVTNKKKEVSVLVPRHKILRGYTGFVLTLESNKFLLPVTFTIDESVFYLATRETIGYTTDTSAELRRLKGVHHRGVAKLSFALDPAKHYNLTIGYENGRLAPNFEYLNKVTVGFRFVYW
jgi:hypothetical protein